MKANARENTTRVGLRDQLLLVGAGTLLVFGAACSSGLEGLDPKGTSPLGNFPESTNLRFGFDPNVPLTQPITALEVAGGMVPTAAGPQERPFALAVFTTGTQIPDADDPIDDTNGIEDVFLAVVDAHSIDRRAFTYGIYGAMRTTRCVTCHQMNVPVTGNPVTDPTPFLTQPHFGNGEGIPPLNDFGPENCENCHFHDWLAPGPTFDLRFDGTNDLFTRAQTPPRGLDIHFSTDPRVLWALGVGQTPFGGAADDDHDGIDEPEDTDGVRRHTPGGIPRFLRRLKEWQDTEDPVTGEPKFSSAEEAMQDIVLVSRGSNNTEAGDQPSQRPNLVFVPNGGFDPDNPTAFAVGTVYVVYDSASTNMVGNSNNGFDDVFRVTVDLWIRPDGSFDLRYRNNNQIHVSNGFGNVAPNGGSRNADIGGNGDRIAFESEAQNLTSVMTGSCRAEIYYYRQFVGTTLVSHRGGMTSTPGDAGAVNPDLSADGLAVAYESDATDLIAGDTNGTRDVFYGLFPVFDPVRASVDETGAEFTGHSTGGSVWHFAGRVKTAFATQDAALPPVSDGVCVQRITRTPTQDANTFIGCPTATSNACAGGSHTSNSSQIWVASTGVNGDGERQGLVQFDVSAIPVGSTILNVEVTFQLQTMPGAGATCPNPIATNLSLHRLNGPWNEATVTHSNRPSQQSASATLISVNTLGAKTFTSTTGLVNDVTAWVAGSNFGWLIDGQSTACTVKGFSSSEGSVPPQLVVDFVPPSPRLLARGTGAGTSCAYVNDSTVGTLNLNQIVGPDGVEPAEEIAPDGTPLAANSANPVISPNGNAVLFESMAMNLDTRRDTGLNRIKDVVLADLSQFDANGFVLPYVVSVTADGDEANGPSHSPRFGAFNPPTDEFPLGLAVYETNATNLGNTDPGDIDGDGVAENANFMFKFLSEGGAVFADFEALPARQGQNRGVVFRNLSSGNPSTFQWDFGDGSTSTVESPVHAYDTPGLYTVSLTSTGVLGTDSRTRFDYVHVLDVAMADFVSTKDFSMSGAPTQAPFVNQPDDMPVIGAIDTTTAGAKLSFALNSDTTTEFPETFRWFLTPVDAMGTPIGGSLLVSSEMNPTIDVSFPSLYDLTLEAEGPGGVGRAIQRLELYRAVKPSFISMPAGNPIRGDAPLQVQFTDTTTGDLADMNAHSWSFGDGNTSTEANPMHTYNEGIFFARLTTNGKGGDTENTRVPVIADGAITAAFTVAPQLGGSVSGVLVGETIDEGPPALVDFVNLSQNMAGAAESYTWNFGIGAPTGQENDRDPVGIPYNLGNPEFIQGFNVSLTTSTAAPPQNRVQNGTVLVYPRPQPTVNVPGPSFKTDPLRPPSLVNLSGFVIGDGGGTAPVYRWFKNNADGAAPDIPFGNGTLAFTHDFEGSGTFQVALECETNGPGGSRQVVRSAPQDVVVTASTFSEWFAQAVDKTSGAKCTNCHQGPQSPGGLEWLSTQPDVASRAAEVHGRIVNVPSQACDTSRMRILPGDPENSVVWAVLQRENPLCSAINMRVNLPGDDAAKEAHIATLRSWIMSGAPNN